MWIAKDSVYQAEKEQFGLRECCEDCSHYCPIRRQCAVLYPTLPHRKETFEAAKDGDRIYFCKMFEAQ